MGTIEADPLAVMSLDGENGESDLSTLEANGYVFSEARYACDLCHYVTSKRHNLISHKESRHEGIRYLCDLCPHAATSTGNLRKHKENKHEGVRYPCDLCYYEATRAYTLKKHKKIKHGL